MHFFTRYFYFQIRFTTCFSEITNGPVVTNAIQICVFYIFLLFRIFTQPQVNAKTNRTRRTPLCKWKTQHTLGELQPLNCFCAYSFALPPNSQWMEFCFGFELMYLGMFACLWVSLLICLYFSGGWCFFSSHFALTFHTAVRSVRRCVTLGEQQMDVKTQNEI